MAMIHEGLEFVVDANFGDSVSLQEAVKVSDSPSPAFADIPEDHWVQKSLENFANLWYCHPV